MKPNLILSFGSGDAVKTETFSAFIKSTLNVGNTDIVILTHDMNEETRVFLDDQSVKVVDIPIESIDYIFSDRHLQFWKYLNEHGDKYEYVLISDCRDVLIQRDPFLWVWDHRELSDKNEFVVFTAEGFIRSASGFACIEHFEFQRDVPPNHRQEDGSQLVCNAGITLGTPKAVQNYEFLMFMTTIKTIGGCTDQAALNYMLHFLKDDKTYYVSNPHDDSLCLTGEGVRSGHVKPVLLDGELYNSNGEAYCLVHQWDRLTEMRDAMMALYK